MSNLLKTKGIANSSHINQGNMIINLISKYYSIYYETKYLNTLLSVCIFSLKIIIIII